MGNHSRWRFGHPCSHMVSYKDTGLQRPQPHNLGAIGSSLFYWLTGSGGAQTKPLKLFLLQKIIGSFLKAMKKRHLARTWATRLHLQPHRRFCICTNANSLNFPKLQGGIPSGRHSHQVCVLPFFINVALESPSVVLATSILYLVLFPTFTLYFLLSEWPTAK